MHNSIEIWDPNIEGFVPDRVSMSRHGEVMTQEFGTYTKSEESTIPAVTITLYSNEIVCTKLVFFKLNFPSAKDYM